MAVDKYTKTLVLETSDGQVTLTDGAARALQRRLDDSERYIHITNEDGAEVYYNISGSGVAALFATVTSGKTAGTELPCEDGIPNCD